MSGTYEFGPFRYDPEQKLLFRDGAVVALVPKAAETLQVLLERRGRVVENISANLSDSRHDILWSASSGTTTSRTF